METYSFSFQFEENSNTAHAITRKMFETYQMEQDAPDEAAAETQWIADKKRLRQVLSQLTKRQRSVYILHVGYNLKEAQIAQLLSLSQSTVSEHLNRAEKKLAKITGETTK